MCDKKFKLLIVDDERKICALIRLLVDWDSLGIEVVGECYNGTAALAKIEELKPEIVITDIRIPGLDGLELVHKVQSAGLNVEFILISGHKNFEYAHTAIKYGIRNYILKPIIQEDLVENILDVKKHILEKKTAGSEVCKCLRADDL